MHAFPLENTLRLGNQQALYPQVTLIQANTMHILENNIIFLT